MSSSLWREAAVAAVRRVAHRVAHPAEVVHRAANVNTAWVAASAATMSIQLTTSTIASAPRSVSTVAATD